MLRNLSKYCLFICCKQSSSTHFCHFLTTAFVTDVLAGSNPSAMGPKKKGPHCWEPIKSVVGDEGYPRAAGAARAPLRRFAPRVLRWKTLRVSSAPHPVGFESHALGPNKNGPLSRTVSNSMVGDEGCRVRLRRPLSLRACGPRVLRWKTLARFLSSAPCRVRIPLRWAQKRKAPIAGSLSNQWWAMRDSNPQPCACKAPALTVAPIARAERV